MTLLICRHMGKNSLVFFEDHYGKELAAESIEGEEFIVPALVSPDIRTEWMTFRRYITLQPKEDTMKLLKELATNSMLVEMFPHLSDLAKIPVGTASVERSFSRMKMIKTRLRNRLGEQNLAHLMRIAIETPEKLPDDIVEGVVDIWNRKPRRNELYKCTLFAFTNFFI